MSAFGRLQAALAAATNEVTIAAANLNFDFTLVKYEAPREFQPIAGVLASQRKHDAENGKTHITARRLGALFEGACPDTPNLIAAYGKRVSEISQKVTDNEPRNYSKSIFAAYAGVDATSIWAAATSSTAAIYVHLLACMLAEFWDATEATSIWVELVSQRRQDIANRLERGETMTFGLAAAAAQQEISREQLASWDASARAWIHTAKSVMVRKHTQLELILKNISLSINDHRAVFSGVTEAWKLALETMEKLISGMPHEVHNGAAVLGVAAWHIYPDIHIFGRKNIDVRFEDPLVAEGGFLSLGCSPAGALSGGIHWSLCLNNLKYYGHPVQKDRTMGGNPSFIPFRDFHYAAIRAILAKWKVQLLEVDIALKVFTGLCEIISIKVPGSAAAMSSTQAAIYQCSHDPEAKRYMKYGMRRTRFLEVLDEEEQRLTSRRSIFWGLLDISTLLQCMPETEQRVELLRRIVARSGLHDQIVYIYDKPSSQAFRIQEGIRDEGLMVETNENKRRTRSKKEKESSKKFVLRGAQLHNTDKTDSETLQFWCGDIGRTAIFNKLPPNALQTVPPNISFEDILWCLEHKFISGDTLMLSILKKDPIMQTIFQLHDAKICFDTLGKVPLHIQCLEKPFLQYHWTSNVFIQGGGGDVETLRVESLPTAHESYATKKWIQIIASLVAGLDIPYSTIPKNVSGISIGDSLIVPTQLLQDPADDTFTKPLTRILGNLGRPGFVIFSSPEEPILAPLDAANWKISNMNTFDGRSEDMLGSTSIHLSFTEWTRTLHSKGSFGMQEVNGLMMESVISVRDQGNWIGDVDAVQSLTSPIVFKMPEQKPCSHPADAQPPLSMLAIECWDELKDCPEENVVVKAHGNWVARLAATSYLVECSKQPSSKIKRITICPPKVCWACVRPEFRANVYVY